MGGIYRDCDLTAEIEELDIGEGTDFVGSGVSGTACVEFKLDTGSGASDPRGA